MFDKGLLHHIGEVEDQIKNNNISMFTIGDVERFWLEIEFIQHRAVFSKDPHSVNRAKKLEDLWALKIQSVTDHQHRFVDCTLGSDIRSQCITPYV